MKKYLLPFLIVAALLGIIALIVSLTYTVPTPKQSDEKMEAEEKYATFKEDLKKHEPNDFMHVRLYPDFETSPAVYHDAIRKAREQAKTTTKSAEVAWTVEGPTNIGGRYNSVVSHPDNANIIYAGASKGGIFKTLNGGATWTPIFDDAAYMAIGPIVLDPTDPETIYVGTGDPNISGFFALGDGVYKSTDGGATWANIGLGEQRIISDILIDPNDPNTIYVSSMGNPLKRNNLRGVYKTTNGGDTWKQVLFVSEEAGVIDMEMNPQNPQEIYAAGWNRIRTTQESMTFGTDAKVYKTENGGDDWTHLTNGLPSEPMSRIGLAIFEPNPQIVYALYVDTDHELDKVYRSDDAGANWEVYAEHGLKGLDSYNGVLGGFGWFFGQINTHPTNEDEVYIMGVDLHKTDDGGESWRYAAPVSYTGEVHADKHALHFINDSLLLMATDGGIYRSIGDGMNWEDIEITPSTQLYRVAVNPHEPGIYMAGAQDNGTSFGGADAADEWIQIFGADGFQPIYHPTNPDLYYVETQRGFIYSVLNGDDDLLSQGYDSGDRTSWDTPYIMSHDDPDVLYRGSYRVYRMEDAPQGRWEPISEDLTDGSIFGDNFHFISALAESPANSNHLYVGTSDANVWRSLDRGTTWENITEGLPGRFITSVHGDVYNENKVYVTSSGYKGNGVIPHLHRSLDNGDTWEDISRDLPNVGVNDLVILPEDFTGNTLFAATDIGVYVTQDGGESWNRMGDMPYLLVFDIEYDAVNRKLVAATFARSVQSFPLEEVVDYSAFSVGLNDTKLQTEMIQIYPNPSTDFIQVKLPETTSFNQALPYRISTIDGRLVQSANLTESNQQLSVQDLTTGMYLLEVNIEGRRMVGRFVKE